MESANLASDSSTTSCGDWKVKAVRLREMRQKMELLAGMIGLESLRERAKNTTTSMAAEESGVRRAMGWQDGACKPTGGDGDMGHTILGDVQYPTPVVVQQAGASGMNPIVAAILGAMIPGAGAAGAGAAYLLQKPDPVPIVQPAPDTDTDTTIELRLRRFDELDTQ